MYRFIVLSCKYHVCRCIFVFDFVLYICCTFSCFDNKVISLAGCMGCHNYSFIPCMCEYDTRFLEGRIYDI